MALDDKRDWFATGESEDEHQGYDSEVAEERKGMSFAARTTKRRKLDVENSSAEGETDDEADSSFQTAREIGTDEDDVGDMGTLGSRETTMTDVKPIEVEDSKHLALLQPGQDKTKVVKRLAKAKAKAAKTGVVYISRVPPFMKPHTLRHLLKPFAPSGLDRVFLTPEDPEVHKSRVKSGGNKKKSFLDGWVEFMSKREAKIATETLNGKNIGGKKGNYYYDDVWNLKYLRGFKWRHLTEQIANENAERDARLRAEAARERNEVREFLRNVEKAKMLDGMEKKKKRKMDPASSSKNDSYSTEKPASGDGRNMIFRQSEVVSKSKKHGEGDKPSAETQRVLSKIF